MQTGILFKKKLPIYNPMIWKFNVLNKSKVLTESTQIWSGVEIKNICSIALVNRNMFFENMKYALCNEN